MTSETTAARLARIRTRFAQLKHLEAKHGFGVLLADGTPLEPVSGVPEGAGPVAADPGHAGPVAATPGRKP